MSWKMQPRKAKLDKPSPGHKEKGAQQQQRSRSDECRDSKRHGTLNTRPQIPSLGPGNKAMSSIGISVKKPSWPAADITIGEQYTNLPATTQGSCGGGDDRSSPLGLPHMRCLAVPTPATSCHRMQRVFHLTTRPWTYYAVCISDCNNEEGLNRLLSCGVSCAYRPLSPMRHLHFTLVPVCSRFITPYRCLPY
jgi:hypothetical protein